jgi:ubiquinone/menaquinone biosynthesis C-methylase UbiE
MLIVARHPCASQALLLSPGIICAYLSKSYMETKCYPNLITSKVYLMSKPYYANGALLQGERSTTGKQTTMHRGDQSADFMQAEFDKLADAYYDQHKSNIAITGELPEYFAEYKIAGLAELVKKLTIPAENILDFGSGIGNSVPYFRKYFTSSTVRCADVSARSIEIAKTRFGGNEEYALIENSHLPFEDASQDIVFSACVFHHIPHQEHQHWLHELKRVIRPRGLLIIYEHNPLNPLTVRAVNSCPLDENAHLIQGKTLRKRVLEAGWEQAVVDYCLFFPSFLSKLRPLENKLNWLALGAQYRLSAIRPL